MDLNRAATFVRVVEAGSFTAAALALHLPTSSVSRSVAKLEAGLGITLLERTTRKLALTDAGRAYFERAREAIAGLGEAEAFAVDAAREPHGVVRVAVPPDMGAQLALIVRDFAARYPRIHLDVVSTGRGAEMVGDAVDLAIVVGALDDSDLIVRRLGAATQRMFASPGYLERRGKPRGVKDLERHDAVLLRGVGGAARWDLVGPRGKESVEVHGPVSCDHHTFVFDCVAAGLGIGQLATYFADPAVADGRLVPVLPKFGSVGAVQSLVHPSRHLPYRVSLLRDFLTATLAAACSGHGMVPVHAA